MIRSRAASTTRAGALALTVGCAVVAVATPLIPRPAVAETAAAEADIAAARQLLRHTEDLLRAGRVDEARATAASVPRVGAYARVHGAFVDGRIAEASGDLPRARDIYREILASHPELARVRLALAGVLARIGDHDASRRHYEMVLGTTGEDTVADRIRADLAALDRAKHWSAQITFSLVPTSNLSNGTAAGTVLIGGIPFDPTASAREKAGLAAVYGVQLAYLQPVADDIGLFATATTSHVDGPGKTWDQRAVEASLGPRFHLGAGVVTAEALISRSWFGTDPQALGWGGRVSGRFLLSNEWRLSAATTLVRQVHDLAPWQTGWRSTSSLALDRAIGSGAFVRLKGTLERQKAEFDHLSHLEIGAALGVHIEAPWGLTLNPEVAHADRRYVENFPLMSAPRHDRRTTFGLSLTKRDLTLFGMAPRLSYAFTHNASNVGFYAYDRHDLNIAVTKDF